MPIPTAAATPDERESDLAFARREIARLTSENRDLVARVTTLDITCEAQRRLINETRLAMRAQRAAAARSVEVASLPVMEYGKAAEA